jgi:hypothetical protein
MKDPAYLIRLRREKRKPVLHRPEPSGGLSESVGWWLLSTFGWLRAFKTIFQDYTQVFPKSFSVYSVSW